MAMVSTQLAAKLNPQRTWQRRLTRKTSAVAATAETFEFDIPRDHFIHEIHISVYEHTAVTRDPTKLADDIVSLQFVANGNKIIKDTLAEYVKAVMQINKRKPQTGLYTLFFTDPKIPEVKPLPAWIFTSLVLKITDNAPAGGAYHTIEIVVTESAYEGQDLSNWRLLIEKYLKWQKYGTNTGEQSYEHERAYKVYGYIFLMDDDGTPDADIYDLLKVLGRKPQGELTIVDVPVPLLKAENDSEIADTLAAGLVFIEWVEGFPANEYASLYTKPNIPVAGTNVGLRVLERYAL